MHMNPEFLFWIAFIAIFSLALLSICRLQSTGTTEESIATALKWTGVWISVALRIGLAITFFYPQNENSGMTTRV